MKDLRITAANERSAEETLVALHSGVDAIVQATFVLGRWYGRADVLRRVEVPSILGPWSYEVYDCKLSADTKAGTILQLELYSEMLGVIQGLPPISMYVVPPTESFTVQKYRVLDYAAYYRSVKRSLERAVDLTGTTASTYPDPVDQCDICAWFSTCDAHRRADDHLSLVAGASKLHRKQLHAWGVQAVSDLAVLPLPLQERPKHSSKRSLTRVREQARVQVEGRQRQEPVFEIFLPIDQEHGFCSLPEPSSGDIFFDLEGDPFVGKTGREYLFGFAAQGEAGRYACEARWCLTANEEKLAFEWFVDQVMQRWEAHPDLHIYHFTAYEPSALKRLMGRFATRESEIDRMLRARLFVDLHTIVKRALRASVESYSLKALEVFHGYTRIVPLEAARGAMRAVQHGLELDYTDLVDGNTRSTVEGYNADDCLSTASLRDWLEQQRQLIVGSGIAVARPERQSADAPESVEANQSRVQELTRDLMKGLPDDPGQDAPEQEGLRLLTNLLDWHRRESKVAWWEFFRLRDLTDEELIDEKSALSGLVFETRLSTARGIPVDRYRFDPQETEIEEGEALCHRGERVGEVISIDLVTRNLDVKKTRKTADKHPSSVYIDCTPIKTQVLADSIMRLAECVTFDGVDAPGPLRASRDLLLRKLPRIAPEALLRREGESTLDAAKRLACSLHESVLPIQGPPGAGKTHTGAEMIVELMQQGKRVGVTANSHTVVRNLLQAVVRAAAQANLRDVKCMQKVTDHPETPTEGIDTVTEGAKARSALAADYYVLGGTAWLWASKEFKQSVDVLFVDEAGQMALANVLAASQAARSVVLLGDPQQLEQPLKGNHPEGAEVSALEHLLAGESTMTGNRGLFLEETWRLHPKLCIFTSEVFYEGRLHSRAGLERQGFVGHPWLGDAGLWFIPVEHDGNRSLSSEEVERTAALMIELLGGGTQWDDGKTGIRDLHVEDILIVAPYNAQVAELAERLPAGSRIGTVDKFQGQQAPIVIYCLTTSSQEDAPRGMEFLFSLNRLNVATSRAKGLVIVLGSPRLLNPDCRTPRQMQLANALCRYVELASIAPS